MHRFGQPPAGLYPERRFRRFEARKKTPIGGTLFGISSVKTTANRPFQPALSDPHQPQHRKRLPLCVRQALRNGGGQLVVFFQRDMPPSSQPLRAGKPLEIKLNLPIYRGEVEPRWNQGGLSHHEIGKYRVYLQQVATGDRELIFKGASAMPSRAADYSTIPVGMEPNNQQLVILYERRDVPQVDDLHDVSIPKNQRWRTCLPNTTVYSMEYINPFSMVFSAAVRGISDIFLYYTNTRQTQRVTDDFWDDLDPVYVRRAARRYPLCLQPPGFPDGARKTGLHTLRQYRTTSSTHDLENRSQELVRVTHTPYTNETLPGSGGHPPVFLPQRPQWRL